ncbi:MAG: hypothetical protein QXI09_00795 [Candidatus Aenigmatarchaeota archaeon]
MKGVVLTTQNVFIAIFIIVIIVFVYYFFMSRYLEMHVTIKEFSLERKTINYALNLISNENIVLGKGNVIWRGILDAEKLDKIFLNTTEITHIDRLVKILITPIDIGVTYPNSLIIIRIIDLETCEDNKCFGWLGRIYSPISIDGLFFSKFIECIVENIKLDFGTVIRVITNIGNPVSAVFNLVQPYDWEKCIENTMPSNSQLLFSKSFISSEGFPVLIYYNNGTTHVGRLSVLIGEVI